MKNNKKLYIFIIVLLSFFLFFLYTILKPYNYNKKYKVNDFSIEEQYDKNKKEYFFYIKYNDLIYPFVIPNKYVIKRELINNIKILNINEDICILPESDKLNFYPICSSNNNLYSYNLNNSNHNFYSYKLLNEKEKEYEKINISNINNLNYLIYNYKGFYFINNDNLKNIELFKKDAYNLSLVYKKDEYVLIPDYNSEYVFSKLYLINGTNGKVKEIKTDYQISFNSVFIGDYKNKVYLIDKSEKKEYEINFKKLKIKEVDFQVLDHNKMVKTNYNKIIQDNISFIKNNIKYYNIKDNILYKTINNIDIKITDNKIYTIIDYIDNTIYYLSNGNLYMYNEINGEVLLMHNFEWNFNYKNIIFLIK